MCSSSSAWRAGNSMALLQKTSVGGYLLRQISCLLAKGAGIIAHSLIARFVISRVWELRHQIGNQHSAAKCTRTRVAVRKVLAPASQIDPANWLKNPTRVVNFFLNELRCRQNGSALFSFTGRYLGLAKYGRARPLMLIVISRRASLSLR